MCTAEAYGGVPHVFVFLMCALAEAYRGDQLRQLVAALCAPPSTAMN
jgi:hypothetical protein